MAEAVTELFFDGALDRKTFVFHVECVEGRLHDDKIPSTIIHEWCSHRFEFDFLSVKFKT